MAAHGPNPARGALKSGPRPGTNKRKIGLMARVMYLSNDPLFWAKPTPRNILPTVSAAYTKLGPTPFFDNLITQKEFLARFMRVFIIFQPFFWPNKLILT